MSEDTMKRLPDWWGPASIVPPCTPDGFGGNEGLVRDATGDVIADTKGFEARADVIAAALNLYAAFREEFPESEEITDLAFWAHRNPNTAKTAGTVRLLKLAAMVPRTPCLSR